MWNPCYYRLYRTLFQQGATSPPFSNADIHCLNEAIWFQLIGLKGSAAYLIDAFLWRIVESTSPQE